MMSIAFTKNVVKNGRINVNHGQCVMIAKIKAAAEMKNKIHINLLFFVSDAIIFCLLQK